MWYARWGGPWVEGASRHSPRYLVGAGMWLGGAATSSGHSTVHQQQQQQQQCYHHHRLWHLPFPWGCTLLVGDDGGGAYWHGLPYPLLPLLPLLHHSSPPSLLSASSPPPSPPSSAPPIPLWGL